MYKILIYQYDSRTINEVDDLYMLISLNKQKCETYHFDYKFFNKYHMDIPPYWVKVFLLRDLLLSNIYDYIIWLDSDAVLHDYDPIKFDQILPKDNIIMTAAKCPYGDQIFNAGVLIMSKYSTDLVNDWCRLYNPSFWIKENNTWRSLGEWAGETYEQGSFVKYILPKYHHNIIIFPHSVMHNSSLNIAPESQFLHFIGSLKVEIRNYLSKFYNIS